MSRKNFSFVIFISFVIQQVVCAEPIPVDTSSSSHPVLLSNQLSAYPYFGQADHMIRAFMKKWGLAGASVAIAKDGKLLYAKGFGYTDLEKKEPVTPLNTFRIASISKLITAVGIMKLVEQEKISLDDQVFGSDGILNQYTHCSDKRVYRITVRHLLTHEAGWNNRYGDHMFMPHYIARYMGEKLPIDDNTIIEFALRKGVHFIPGSMNSYSNLGYVILGKIIEKVSGMPYEEYINHEILNPLEIYGMSITSNKYEEKGPYEVKYYAPGARKRLSIYSTAKYAPRTYEGTDFETLGAAGGWVASASQLMKLLTAIDGHAYHEDMLSCNMIDSMTTLDDPDKYCFGWVHSDNCGNWWRTGTLSGTSAFMMRRADGISFAFITNTSTWRAARFAYDIKKMMLDAIDTISWWPSEDLFPCLIDSEKYLSASE